MPHRGLEEEIWEVKDAQEGYLSYSQLQSYENKVKSIENSHPEPQQNDIDFSTSLNNSGRRKAALSQYTKNIRY
jgi:hypothetical protein